MEASTGFREMRWILLIGLFSGAAIAQTPPVASATPAGSTAAVASTPAVASAPAVTSAATAAPQSAEKVQAGMAAALAQQRASVLKQVSAASGKAPPPAASFFTVPWIETPASFNLPACDPLPAGQLDELVQNSSKQEGVKPDLIRAVIDEESGGRACAVSWKGAQGLMQLMPATADLLGVKDAFDPQQNVAGGTKLLKQLLGKYNGDISLVLAAYNAGEDRVDRDGGVPSIPETKNYVTDIQTKLAGK